MRVVLVKSEDTENYNLELWVVERCESSYETVKVDKNRWNFSKDIVDETSDEKCMSSSELWIFLWWDEVLMTLCEKSSGENEGSNDFMRNEMNEILMMKEFVSWEIWWNV